MPRKKTLKIKNISAREILDSRGNPTVEAKLELENGIFAKASVPSGASTGVHEAKELRDGDKKRYAGLGVLKACENINKKINRKLSGMNAADQQTIDKALCELDGTLNKSNLGANAILVVSLATARAGAIASSQEIFDYLQDLYSLPKNKKIPIPMFNIFNGGKHADTNLDLQEFMVVPLGIKGFNKQLQAGAEIFHELAKVLHAHHLDTDVGNEGGYAPNIDSTIQAFEMIIQSIKQAGYKPGQEIGLALDVGASELFDPHKRLYSFKLDDNYFIADQLISLYRDWAHKYPIFSIEDGLAEDEWPAWETLVSEFSRFKTKTPGQPMLVVGDDLFTTNVKRLQAGVERKAANAVILKPNQIGTLTEAIEFGLLAQKNKFTVITSHRSGETTDDFISDLAVALGSDFVKFGSLSRGERVVKYNRLLEISTS